MPWWLGPYPKYFLTPSLSTCKAAQFVELRKIYYRVGIHKSMDSLFSTFVIYFNLKLQIATSILGGQNENKGMICSITLH
jgi:hypothetical protein